MRHCQTFRALAAAAICLHLTLGAAGGQVDVWQFGGDGGSAWGDFTRLNVLADDFSDPRRLQPRELDPEVNLLPQLSPWHGLKQPIEFGYMEGQPRIWRGVNYRKARLFFPLDFIDGDVETYVVNRDSPWIWWEYYTIDVGAPIPAERFRFYPPDGIDHITDQPYRPGYTPQHFELTASNNAEAIAREGEDFGTPERPTGVSEIHDVAPSLDDYRPLETLLFESEQYFSPDGIVNLTFPLGFYRFFRLRSFPTEENCFEGWTERSCFETIGFAEMEIYGRGFVPEATWLSTVVDLGESVNFGRVVFSGTRLRRENGGLVPAPEAPAVVEVEVRVGDDDTPVAYYGYNKRGAPTEVTRDEYEKLRVNRPELDPRIIGWRGPLGHDSERWSFWSAPAGESGTRPVARKGRYFQLRVRLKTDRLREFVRLDSLGVEFSTLLADRVVGEIAAADDLHPAGNLTKVRAGETGEFAYDLRAEFSGEDRTGFDAVRVVAPSEAEFRGLEMGDPPAAVEPDGVISEGSGFSLLLPRPVTEGEPPLRIRLATALYGASGTFGGEVFQRDVDILPQPIEAGDASEAVGTNRLQLVAYPASLGEVLGSVAVEPRVLTPQGDGVNDKVLISYSMLRIQEGADVEVTVYGLSGEPVRTMRSPQQVAGRHSAEWDGRDDRGRLVPPGTYVASIRVATSEGDFGSIHPVAVAY